MRANESRSTRIAPAALIAPLALFSLAGPLWALGGYDLATLFADDAFYYFQIARNVAHGHGPTFDGIHETNGFHPLWLLLLVPVFGSVSGLDAGVRAAGTLEAALIAIAAVGLYRGVRSRWGADAGALAALSLFALPGTRGVLRTGLEGALTVALLVGTWCVWQQRRAGNARDWSLVGACFALLALARIETLALWLALAVWERKRLHAQRHAALALLAPVAVTMAIYGGLSLARFGVALPISGLVKRALLAQQPAITLLGIPLPRALWTPLAAGLLLAAGVYVAALCARRLRSWLGDTGVGWLLLGALSMWAADLLMLGTVNRWYWSPGVPGLALGGGIALRRWPRLSRIAVALLVVTAVVRVPFTVSSSRAQRRQAHLRGEAADGLRALTPPVARIGAWNGGMLGYYAGRSVVMLDGLANDVDFYQRVVVNDDLAGYLRRERISALAVTSPCAPGRLFAGAGSAAAVDIERRYTVRRSLARDRSADPCGSFALWMLPP
jgi:hypothetical protein